MNTKSQEILNILQEESAEVIQIISKINRFGLTGFHPNDHKTNKERLEEELGDLQCMINLLIENGIVNKQKINVAENAKLEKLKKWSNIFYE